MNSNIITEEIREFVDKVKLGFVATVCPDGTPNLSPKGSTIVWDSENLAFADVCSPGTIANLKANPSIEINVVDIFVRKGYRFKGTAEVLSQGPVFNQIVSFYRSRGAILLIKNIVLVRVDKIEQVVSPAYDSGQTESEIKSKWMKYWELRENAPGDL